VRISPEEEADMPEAPRTFRVFVSSTFKDLEEERNVLLKEVYPDLRRFCADRGARFQPIDLRWGVSEEASLDQQAMNICLGEIERCREITPRPNFIVLLGNRHGWLALPPQIRADEFEQIRSRVPPGGARQLLDEWYARDDNAVLTRDDAARVGEPGWELRDGQAVLPAYYLRPRAKGGPYEKYEDWEPVEQRLHAILVEAVKGTALEDDPRYYASATEQEILAGAVGIGGPADRAFCFVRELVPGHPDPTTASKGDPILDYVDRDQTPLNKLKGRLDDELPVKTYSAQWDSRDDRPTTGHLHNLARDVREALERAILEEIEHRSTPPRRAAAPDRIVADDALDPDGIAHHDFAEERALIFVGREDSLTTIARYLAGSDPRPLVISGEGGSGKSALLAEALRRAQRDHPDAGVVYRFIGATPGSSDGRALLQGVCRELARRRYGADEDAVPTDYQELSSDFRERLGSAAADRRLIVFLDSLDQLSASQGARGLAWLPTSLPEHVRIVVSTRPEDTLETLVRRAAPVEELGPLPSADGRELLRRWLEEVQRTLRPDQERRVVAAFEASNGNPLYLRLAFEEARRWRSGDEQQEDLAVRVERIIEHNTFARLAEEDNHGETLVSHALGYLTASRYGLSEDELLDLLSRDPEVYAWFVRGAHHVPFDLREHARAYRGTDEGLIEWLGGLRTEEARRAEVMRFLEEVVPRPDGPRLPVVLWSRLAFDLLPYLTERDAEGAVLISFFHRELGDVARSRYLGDGRSRRFHGKLADYFRPLSTKDDRRRWDEASAHALSELPYHLAEAERLDDLFETLTDFVFLEHKAAEVGVVEQTDGTKTYTGVFQLQDDYELALAKMGGDGAAAAGRRPLIVTGVDFRDGNGLVLCCPWCNTSSPFQDGWRGTDIPCPDCAGPLRVNSFVVGERREA
jgi:NACHT domain- and WD repeat-containing protein